MASTKTIRLKIALDGEREFKAAMQAVKKESSLLRTELKNLDEKYRGNANSLEALETKQKTLAEAQETYTKRVKAASEGLENAKKNETEQAQRLEDLRDKLEEAKKAMEAMEKAGDTTSEAYKEQQKRVDELSQAVKDQIIVYSKTEGAVSDWRKELSTANHNLEECNEEITKNDKYLEEARQSADHCATSIDKYGDEVGEAATESEKLSVSLGDMVKNKVVDILGDALMKMGQKAIEAAKYVLEVGSSFEAAMSEVGAISGASAKEMDALSEKAKEMGAKTKFSATESAEALQYMAMAGWKTNDMIDGLEGIMNLAAASGEDLATTSDIVTDALTAFGQTSKESGRLADIMAAASSNANTNVGMMGETFKYAAPVAGALGYSMEDTALAIGLMANSGIKASSAGTALRSGLTRLAAPTKQVKEAMDKYGISLTDTDGKMLSFRDLMLQLREKLGGLSEAEQTAAVSALAGKNAMSGWLAIINGSDADFDKLAGAIDNSNGSAERMMLIMQDNLAGKIDILKSALEGLGIAAYNYVSGPLQGVVEFVTGIISGITEAITPQRTELESFIDDISEANDQVEKSLEHARQTADGGEAKKAEIEAYQGMLDGILDSCEQFNLVTLDNGKQAIVDSSGTIVKTFEEIDTSANTTEEILEQWASGGLNTTGIAKTSGTAQELIGFVADSVDTVESRLDNFAESGINTDGVNAGVSAVVQVFDDLGTEIMGYETAIDEAGNVELDTGSIQSGTELVVTYFNNASGKVETFKTDIESLNGSNLNLSKVAEEFTQVEDSVKRTYTITDEFTKAKISHMVDTLGGSVDGLSDAWDRQTGKLTATRTELENWFDTAKEVAVYEALQDALKEMYDAWGEAAVNQAKAESALSKAQEELNAYMDEYGASSEYAIMNADEWASKQVDLENNVKKAADEQERANEAMRTAEEEINTTGAALSEMKGKVEGLLKPTEEAGKSAEDAANSVGEYGDESKEAADQVEKLTEKQQEAITALGEMYKATDEDLAAIRESLGYSESDFADWAQGIIDVSEEIEEAFNDLHGALVKEFEEMTFDLSGEGSPLDNLEKNLKDRSEKLRSWVFNMQELMAQLDAGNLDQSVYDALVAMGPEKGADAAAAFADGFRNGNYEQIDRIQSEFATQMDLSQNAYLIASATSTGQAYVGNLETHTVEGLRNVANATIAEAAAEAGKTASNSIAGGISENSPLIEEALDSSVTTANDSAKTEAENAKDTGTTMGDRTKEGIESTKQEVKEATEGMIENARQAGETLASEFHRVGQIIPQKIKQGINEANGMGVGPTPAIESLMRDASNAVSSSDQNFYNSGWNSAVAVGNGIIGGTQNAVNAAIYLANAVNDAYNSTLQIHSPSRVMEKGGVRTVEGTEVGFEKETPKAVRKVKKSAEKIAEAYDEGLKKTKTESMMQNLSLSIIRDSADTMSPIASLTDHAMGTIGSTMDRTQAAIAKMTADLGRKLDRLAEALNVTVFADFGTDRFDARTVRVVKQAISKDNKALKASKGR